MVIGYRWVVACVRSAGIIFMTTHRLCAVYHSDVRRYTKDCSCLAMPKNPSLRKIERRKKRHGAICCNYCFLLLLGFMGVLDGTKDRPESSHPEVWRSRALRNSPNPHSLASARVHSAQRRRD